MAWSWRTTARATPVSPEQSADFAASGTATGLPLNLIVD